MIKFHPNSSKYAAIAEAKIIRWTDGGTDLTGKTAHILNQDDFYEDEGFVVIRCEDNVLWIPLAHLEVKND